MGTTYANLVTGAYRLLATPPRGAWHYRVRVVSGSGFYGTVSPAFTLRAR